MPKRQLSSQFLVGYTSSSGTKNTGCSNLLAGMHIEQSWCGTDCRFSSDIESSNEGFVKSEVVAEPFGLSDVPREIAKIAQNRGKPCPTHRIHARFYSEVPTVQGGAIHIVQPEDAWRPALGA